MIVDELITSDGILKFCLENDITYIKTDFFYTGQFIWRGNIHPQKLSDKIVIGHSDYPVVTSIAEKFSTILCVNRETYKENTFGIPLGLTNDCDDSPIHRIYGNRDIIIEVMNKEVEKENLLYMNFNISNYPIERQFVFDLFKDFEGIKIGYIDNSLEGRRNFLKEIKSSKFVICPRGNGVDTHRLWETLYMGSIPIVKYENTHHLFTDLPILFIKDWNEITEDFLNDKYLEIINKEWNLQKLKMSYWNNFIKEKMISNE